MLEYTPCWLNFELLVIVIQVLMIFVLPCILGFCCFVRFVSFCFSLKEKPQLLELNDSIFITNLVLMAVISTET